MDWQAFLEENGFEDWTCSGDGAIFYCPDDGNGIEPDGKCYCGQESPLLQMGVI